MSKTSQVLRCQDCNKKFSEQDVEDLNFFPDIHTCVNCCQNERAKPHSTNCFGKKNTVTKQGTITAYGYDPEGSVDCSTYCDYRRVCGLFAQDKIDKLRMAIMIQKAVDKATPFRHKNSIIAKAFLKATKGTTKRKLVRFINSEGGDSSRVMRILRSGSSHGYEWLYDEADGRIKIHIKVKP